MKMSSQGTFTACNNSITVNNKEDSVRSTEKQYSFVPQANVFNPKTNARAKFQQKRRSKRKEKNKQMRKGGNQYKVSKNPPKPKKGEIQVTNDSVDYVHQSLVERIYPTALVNQAKSTLISLNTDANISQLFEVLEVVGALAISLPMCQTPAQVASQILLSVRAMTKGSVTEAVLRQMKTIE